MRLTRSGDYFQHGLSIEWDLIGLARVALTRGRPARAALLLGAAETVFLRSGPVPPSRRYDLDRAASDVRTEMAAAEFEAAWAAGRAAPLDQVIAEALEEAPAG